MRKIVTIIVASLTLFTITTSVYASNYWGPWYISSYSYAGPMQYCAWTKTYYKNGRAWMSETRRTHGIPSCPRP